MTPRGRNLTSATTDQGGCGGCPNATSTLTSTQRRTVNHAGNVARVDVVDVFSILARKETDTFSSQGWNPPSRATTPTLARSGPADLGRRGAPETSAHHVAGCAHPHRGRPWRTLTRLAHLFDAGGCP